MRFPVVVFTGANATTPWWLVTSYSLTHLVTFSNAFKWTFRSFKMTFLCREFCVHHIRPAVARLSSPRTTFLAHHEISCLLQTHRNRKRGFQRRQSHGLLTKRTSLQAGWVEPVIAVGIPTLFASLFGWSLTELQKLRSRIRELESMNEESRKRIEQSEAAIDAQQAEITSVEGMTPKQEEPEEVNRLKDEIARLHEEWSVDQNRVRVLEKARAAAVKDVTIALGSKRNAEFKLKDAIDRTKTLSEELTLKNVSSNLSHWSPIQTDDYRWRLSVSWRVR